MRIRLCWSISVIVWAILCFECQASEFTNLDLGTSSSYFKRHGPSSMFGNMKVKPPPITKHRPQLTASGRVKHERRKRTSMFRLSDRAAEHYSFERGNKARRSVQGVVFEAIHKEAPFRNRGIDNDRRLRPKSFARKRALAPLHHSANYYRIPSGRQEHIYGIREPRQIETDIWLDWLYALFGNGVVLRLDRCPVVNRLGGCCQGEYCGTSLLGNRCYPRKTDGELCTRSAECLSYSCVLFRCTVKLCRHSKNLSQIYYPGLGRRSILDKEQCVDDEKYYKEPISCRSGYTESSEESEPTPVHPPVVTTTEVLPPGVNPPGVLPPGYHRDSLPLHDENSSQSLPIRAIGNSSGSSDLKTDFIDFHSLEKDPTDIDLPNQMELDDFMSNLNLSGLSASEKDRLAAGIFVDNILNNNIGGNKVTGFQVLAEEGTGNSNAVQGDDFVSFDQVNKAYISTNFDNLTPNLFSRNSSIQNFTKHAEYPSAPEEDKSKNSTRKSVQAYQNFKDAIESTPEDILLLTTPSDQDLTGDDADVNDNTGPTSWNMSSNQLLKADNLHKSLHTSFSESIRLANKLDSNDIEVDEGVSMEIPATYDVTLKNDSNSINLKAESISTSTPNDSNTSSDSSLTDSDMGKLFETWMINENFTILNIPHALVHFSALLRDDIVSYTTTKIRYEMSGNLNNSRKPVLNKNNQVHSENSTVKSSSNGRQHDKTTILKDITLNNYTNNYSKLKQITKENIKQTQSKNNQKKTEQDKISLKNILEKRILHTIVNKYDNYGNFQLVESPNIAEAIRNPSKKNASEKFIVRADKVPSTSGKISEQKDALIDPKMPNLDDVLPTNCQSAKRTASNPNNTLDQRSQPKNTNEKSCVTIGKCQRVDASFAAHSDKQHKTTTTTTNKTRLIEKIRSLIRKIRRH